MSLEEVLRVWLSMTSWAVDHRLPNEASTYSAFAAIFSFLTAATTLTVTLLREEAVRVRGRRTAMTEAHLRMTTGEVARARQLAGDLSYGSPDRRALLLQTRLPDLISAFYTTAWTIEYVDNVRRTWLREDKGAGDSRFLRWNEGELHRNAVHLREVLRTHDASFNASSAHVWQSVGRIIADRRLVELPES